MAGREHWLGKIMHLAGFRVMGSTTGIIMLMTFVGLPFYINTVKDCFYGADSPFLRAYLGEGKRSDESSPRSTQYRHCVPGPRALSVRSGSAQFESLMTAGDILSKKLKEGDQVTISFDSAQVHTL